MFLLMCFSLQQTTYKPCMNMLGFNMTVEITQELLNISTSSGSWYACSYSYTACIVLFNYLCCIYGALRSFKLAVGVERERSDVICLLLLRRIVLFAKSLNEIFISTELFNFELTERCLTW